MIECVIHTVGYGFLGLMIASTFILLTLSVYDAVSGCMKSDCKKENVEPKKEEKADQKEEDEKKDTNVEEESKADIEEIKLITRIVENNATEESQEGNALVDTDNLEKKTIEISDDENESDEQEKESNAGSDEEKTEESDLASTVE